MLIVDVWKSNRKRAGGRYNLVFFWIYPLCLPASLLLDFVDWLERAITPKDPKC
jgi:hypothetical protein